MPLRIVARAPGVLASVESRSMSRISADGGGDRAAVACTRMSATIVVGVDDSPRSEDAVALARALADAAGAEVLAVCAFPYDDRPEAHFNLAMRPLLQELADKTLDKLCEPLTDDAHVRRLAVADLSPARALERVAREQHARADRRRAPATPDATRRLHPGSTAERLLQGAPCPVALAPARLPHCGRTSSCERISVGYDALAGGRPRALGRPARRARRRRPAARDPRLHARLAGAAVDARDPRATCASRPPPRRPRTHELERTVAALPEGRLGRARVPARRPGARARPSSPRSPTCW